jgi:manganese transport protein
MDPGNWSTDIGGGSAYNYDLLFVILVSSIVAVFLQALAVKCGIVFDRDLAQACRDAYSRPVVICLWVITEIAIIATDLAEVLGSAIALKLLFGWPLLAGVLVTAGDVLIVLMVQVREERGEIEMCSLIE